MISKPDNCIGDVHFLIHANEHSVPIAELALKYFDRYIGLDKINISVMSNRFPDRSLLEHTDKVNYISGDIDYMSSGHHYNATITNAISFIKQKYIFMFCEDYILTEPIDVDALHRMVNLFDENDIDILSLSSFLTRQSGMKFKTFEHSTKYGFREDDLLWTDKKHMHIYSVQPCIWRKSSLEEIVKYNPNMTIHHLDTAHICDKKGRFRNFDGSKGICGYSDWPAPEDEYNLNALCTSHTIFDYGYPPEYFIISYIEVLRRGKFHQGLGNDNWVHKKMMSVVEENGLKSNPAYSRYF